MPEQDRVSDLATWDQKRSWLGITYVNAWILVFCVWGAKKAGISLYSAWTTEPMDGYDLVLPALGLLGCFIVGSISVAMISDALGSWYKDRGLKSRLRFRAKGFRG